MAAPMAESARKAMTPPWTTSLRLAVAAETAPRTLPPALAGDGEAGRGGPRHQAAGGVEDVRLAEEQGPPDLDHPTDGADASLDDRAHEVDLQLDGGVRLSLGLQRQQRHAHGGVRDLGDDPSLDHAARVAVAGVGVQLDHRPAGLDLGQTRAERLLPPRARPL